MIEFRAYAKGSVFKAETAIEVISEALKTSARKITVTEFRGGVHQRSLFGTNPNDCFFKEFTRNEAISFVKATGTA